MMDLQAGSGVLRRDGKTGNISSRPAHGSETGNPTTIDASSSTGNLPPTTPADELEDRPLRTQDEYYEVALRLNEILKGKPWTKRLLHEQVDREWQDPNVKRQNVDFHSRQMAKNGRIRAMQPKGYWLAVPGVEGPATYKNDAPRKKAGRPTGAKKKGRGMSPEIVYELCIKTQQIIGGQFTRNEVVKTALADGYHAAVSSVSFHMGNLRKAGKVRKGNKVGLWLVPAITTGVDAVTDKDLIKSPSEDADKCPTTTFYIACKDLKELVKRGERKTIISTAIIFKATDLRTVLKEHSKEFEGGEQAVMVKTLDGSRFQEAVPIRFMSLE